MTDHTAIDALIKSQLISVDAAIEVLSQRRDTAALVDLQEQLIDRSNALESALWTIYRDQLNPFSLSA
jgi:phosphorylcholine metabolism protein LicD